MQPVKRPLFICSAIEKCRETVNCCAHKTPHIKDERCIPRECRHAPDAGLIDCDPYDPENPRAPIPEPVAPAKTVEQVMREKENVIKDGDTIAATISGTIESDGTLTLKSISVSEETAKELANKQEVKAAPAQRTTQYAPGPKTELAKEAGKAHVPKKGGRKKV